MPRPLRNTIFYLVGPSGVGKYTIGGLIAARTGAYLIHNHFWNNVVFGLIETERNSPLPEAIWDRADEVRWAVLQTIADLAPRERSYVFTHAAVGDGDEFDRRIASQIFHVAEKRGARLLPVRLICSAEELARRVRSPGRASMLKSMDEEAARTDAGRVVFDPGFPGTVTLDTTTLSPEDATGRILQALN